MTFEEWWEAQNTDKIYPHTKRTVLAAKELAEASWNEAYAAGYQNALDEWELTDSSK